MQRATNLVGRSLRTLTAFLVAGILITAPSGCGGGSTGTGGQVFDGSVVDGRSQPLANVSVTITALDVTAVTDASGAFEIETAPISGDIDFKLSRDGTSAATKIDDIPGDAERVTVLFEFEPDQSTARPIAVDVERKPSSSSSRSPSSSSSSQSSSSRTSSSSSRDDNGEGDGDGASSSDDDSSSSRDDDGSSSRGGDDNSSHDSSDSDSSDSSSSDDNSGSGHGGGSGNGGSSSRSRDDRGGKSSL